MATKKADAKAATGKASVKEKAKKPATKNAAVSAEQAPTAAPAKKKPSSRKKVDPAQGKSSVQPASQTKASVSTAVEGQKITVTTENGDFPATVIAVHGGNRVDAVLTPDSGQPSSLGTVPHHTDTDEKPYWQ